MNLKTNMLLIEDDKNTCSFIITSLAKCGYHVIPAYSGEEGLRLAASDCPEIGRAHV